MRKIELDSVRRYKNKSEWRNVNRATCGDIVSVGDGDNIRKVCKELVISGYSGPVEVWRGSTPVFGAIPAKTWSEGRALSGEVPASLRKGKDR